METPRPTVDHARLAAFAGTWHAEERLFPSPFNPRGGTATGRLVARMALDGFFLVSDYVETRDGVETYRGHGVYGWDAARRAHTMHWFDSMCGQYAEPALGTWDGNVLTYRLETPRVRARYVYEVLAEDRYRFRIEHSPDGVAWAPFLEAVMTRER
jgi:hypothetical protein